MSNLNDGLEQDTINISSDATDPTTNTDKIVSPNNRDLAWLRARAIVPDPNNHRWYGVMGGIGRYNRDWESERTKWMAKCTIRGVGIGMIAGGATRHGTPINKK